MKAIILLLASASLIAADRAPPNVRVIPADERKACKYLGLVTAQTSSHSDNPGFALKKALVQVEKLGGDSFYIVGQSQDWLNGASVNGEALRCGAGN